LRIKRLVGRQLHLRDEDGTPRIGLQAIKRWNALGNEEKKEPFAPDRDLERPGD
jgi:hypothetical protein